MKIIVKSLCFQEEMMVKEDPIKLEKKKNLKKKHIKENSMAVYRPIDHTQWVIDRPVDHTQQRRNTVQSVNKQQALSIDWHTCRQQEAQNWIQVSFLALNKTQILFIERFVSKD